MLRQVTNQAIRSLATRVEPPQRAPSGYGGSHINPSNPEAAMGRSKHSYEQSQSRGQLKETKASEERARGVDLNENMKSDTHHEGKEAKEELKEKYQEMKKDVKEAYNQQGSQGVIETAKEKAHDTKEIIQEKMHEAKEKTAEAVEKAKEWVKEKTGL